MVRSVMSSIIFYQPKSAWTWTGSRPIWRCLHPSTSFYFRLRRHSRTAPCRTVSRRGYSKWTMHSMAVLGPRPADAHFGNHSALTARYVPQWPRHYRVHAGRLFVGKFAAITRTFRSILFASHIFLVQTCIFFLTFPSFVIFTRPFTDNPYGLPLLSPHSWRSMIQSTMGTSNGTYSHFPCLIWRGRRKPYATRAQNRTRYINCEFMFWIIE